MSEADLANGHPYGHPHHCVEVVLDECLYGGDAAGDVDQVDHFQRVLHLLHPEATHEVDEVAVGVRPGPALVVAARVGDTAPTE